MLCSSVLELAEAKLQIITGIHRSINSLDMQKLTCTNHLAIKIPRVENANNAKCSRKYLSKPKTEHFDAQSAIVTAL